MPRFYFTFQKKVLGKYLPHNDPPTDRYVQPPTPHTTTKNGEKTNFSYLYLEDSNRIVQHQNAHRHHLAHFGRHGRVTRRVLAPGCGVGIAISGGCHHWRLPARRPGRYVTRRRVTVSHYETIDLARPPQVTLHHSRTACRLQSKTRRLRYWVAIYLKWKRRQCDRIPYESLHSEL